MLSLLLMVGPLSAAITEEGFQPAAIIEQPAQRLSAVYSSSQTPEEQVRDLLQRAFVDPISEWVLSAESIDEILYRLNDPYSSFMTPEQYNSFISPGTTGIGVYIDSVPQGILVKSLIPGSPAAAEGLQAGDIISQVKEEREELWVSLAGLSAEQGSSLIRGPAGSRVDLMIIREGQLLQFTLTRKKIELPPVTASMLDPGTACIELSTFLNNESGPSTSVLFAEALQELEAQGAQSYILDLRDNGGGYVYLALDISGYFIGDKPAMQVRPQVSSENAWEHELLISKPLLILINQNTASASEILSGALKDYDRALFLGQNTYGKGCMQSIYPIYEQGKLYGYLKITTARYYTPLGQAVDQIGISPDITIRHSDPLLAARLLLSATASGSSASIPTDPALPKNLVKLTKGEQAYCIDIDQARQLEYWPVYSEIIENAVSILFQLPESDTWIQADPEQLQARWPLYYPGYQAFPSLDKQPGEAITISFSQAIDPACISAQAVELREKESGLGIELEFHLKNKTELELIPQEQLQPGKEYWLLIHPGAPGIHSQAEQLPLEKGCMAITLRAS